MGRLPTNTVRESFSVYAPDVIRLGTGGYRMYYAAWGIGKAGDNASKLENQLTCPPEEACRIQIELRKPETPVSPDSERYRINHENEAPHQSPEGGQIPDRENRRVYD